MDVHLFLKCVSKKFVDQLLEVCYHIISTKYLPRSYILTAMYRARKVEVRKKMIYKPTSLCILQL